MKLKNFAKSNLFKLFVLIVVSTSETIKAAPYHACTFLKERLIASSWPGGLKTGCANFNVTYGACVKYHCTPFGCISYDGTVVSGYLPDYIIEVTPFFGRSAFELDLDSRVMASQLRSAVATWETNYPSIPTPPGIQNGYDETRENNGQVYHHSLYGRMLATPYEDPIWRVTNLEAPVGKTLVGSVTGFAGISEFDPHTWNDGLLDPDKKISAPLLPATNFACHGDISAAMGAIQTAKQVIGNIPLPNFKPGDTGFVIALPVTPVTASYGNFRPDSDALSFMQDPTRMCMGKLGPLLPRSGHSLTSDRYTAAQIAAWRIASLTYDHFSAPFGTHVGGVSPDDKWQILWPPVAPTSSYCFSPGGLNTPPLTINPLLEALTHVPVRAGLDTLVIGVWKRRSSCVEPWETATAIAEITLSYPARVAACQILNRTDLMP